MRARGGGMVRIEPKQALAEIGSFLNLTFVDLLSHGRNVHFVIVRFMVPAQTH